jgi:cholesterol oxidase
MSYLSLPIGELRASYDVIVVGSGYGGGVAALRMAEVQRSGGKPSVCVLERGREWRAGDFPSTLISAVRQLQFDSPALRLGRSTALFDVRYDRDMAVLVGCGLGGTSLINANVMIEPADSVFGDERWPAPIRHHKAELEPYYEEARWMLGATDAVRNEFVPKRNHLFAAAAPGSTVFTPPIAVSFTSGHAFSPADRPPAVHRQPRRCRMCGDCVTGCNHGAKNTTDRNYVAGASDRGAAIFCGVTVRSVEPAEDGWLIHAALVDRAWSRFRSPDIVLRAGTVFLGAGTLGSTEILLRSRTRHKLPLSPRLGSHFSGNGDVIAFSYNGKDKVDGFGYGAMVPDDASAGPTITGMIDEREVSDGPALTIQDAAIPGALAPLIRFTAPFIARRTRLRNFRRDFTLRHVRAELDTMLRGIRHGAVAFTQAFLVMGRDSARGQLKLSRRGRLRIVWPGAASDELFRAINGRLARLTTNMGGRFVANPMWVGYRKRLLTVHPLGGCSMGDRVEEAVVNDRGQVFAASPARLGDRQTNEDGERRLVHTGLYVCDGAVVPTALGTNPALTITALAERMAAYAAPDVPISRGKEETLAPSDFAAPGIQYAERLVGPACVAERETPIELVLHISADDVKKLLVDPRHEARIIGTARTPALPRHPEENLDNEWTVTNGFLNVLVEDPRQPCTRLMVYRLELTSPRGVSIFLRGHKTINLEECRQGTWRAISSFSFALHTNHALHAAGPAGPGSDEAAPKPFSDACDWVARETGTRAGARCRVFAHVPSIGHGRVRNRFPDALRLAASLEITKERRLLRRTKLVARFAWSFASTVIQARFWALQRTKRPDPFTRPVLRVPPTNPKCAIKDSKSPAPGLPRYTLTPYGTPGDLPLILGPGFGMSSEAFHSGEPSFVTYLNEHGYEVWLLDYRGSDKLDISLTQFSIDELVTDFADAITELHGMRQQPVRVIGHCVASLVMSMLLLKEGDLGGKIHWVGLSQSFAFMDQPLINRIKAGIHLPQLLKLSGFIPMLTVDDDLRSDWRSRLLDRALRFYPTAEHCDSAVCRRILFLYGEVVRHAKLDQHTHDLMYDFFDRANLTAFVQLAAMIRAGHIVDKFGRNTYLTDANGQGIRVPVTLFQGTKNRLFRPAGGHRTLKWLREHGGGMRGPDDLFQLVPIDGYGHLDNFVGAHAADEVFPIFLEKLRRMERLARRAGGAKPAGAAGS